MLYRKRAGQYGYHNCQIMSKVIYIQDGLRTAYRYKASLMLFYSNPFSFTVANFFCLDSISVVVCVVTCQAFFFILFMVELFLNIFNRFSFFDKMIVNKHLLTSERILLMFYQPLCILQILKVIISVGCLASTAHLRCEM